MPSHLLQGVTYNGLGGINRKGLDSESVHPLGLKQQKLMFIPPASGLMDLPCQKILARGWLLKRRGEHGFRRACG